ncbi:hypothetical protein JYU34_010519 [Plutella xylostella]|uniref:Uncharacterized protein n=2 Tax=Plutella xylostella TaxID=51655 RepID=A0ABQ7QIL9_PLUXY|nr:hypothetical protein JYU34_010519 [Plutella xylostella]
MKRGKKSEKEVIMNLQRELNKEIEDTGFILINGLFGASPDGVGDEFVVDVKCPISDKTKTTYINNGKISNKFMGQANKKEMLAANKMKCLFCVADPGFEIN